MTTKSATTARNQGIGIWPERRRVKSAKRPALIHHDYTLSYDQLARRVARLADALSEQGVRAGDRIAYLGNNHPAFVEALFASGLIGAVFVPLNTRLAPNELSYMLEDCGARVLINALSLEGVAGSAVSSAAIDMRVVVDDISVESPHSPAADRTGEASTLDYEPLLRSGGEHPTIAEVVLDDPALIIYTSGTTGRPKGAVLTHGNVLWNCLNVLVDYDITSTDRSLMISPLFHVASLGMGCLPTLMKGGTVILEEKFEPGSALALIERHRATMISGVPTTYQMLCEHPDWDSTDISSLHTLTCGGSAVPMRVLETYERRGLSFSGGYGMTETSPGLTALQARYSRPKAGSAGLPHFFSNVRLVDEAGADVQPNETGEILAKGPNVIHEYWNRGEATEASFTQDGWFHTGDVGHVDDEGFLYISDRIKDMIISGGENIYSAEVEAVIMQLDEVEAAAVIGIPNERWGEVPHAILVLADGASLDSELFRTHMRAQLAGYKIPKSFQIVPEMPRTSSGKIQKQVLRSNPPTGEIVGVRNGTPSTSIPVQHD